MQARYSLNRHIEVAPPHLNLDHVRLLSSQQRASAVVALRLTDLPLVLRRGGIPPHLGKLLDDQRGLTYVGIRRTNRGGCYRRIADVCIQTED